MFICCIIHMYVHVHTCNSSIACTWTKCVCAGQSHTGASTTRGKGATQRLNVVFIGREKEDEAK